MPKKGKGGKNKRRGKNESTEFKRELTFKEDGQEYAQVLRMLGNGRLEAYCFDGVKRLCHIRGQMKRRVWIGMDDIVLVGLRDYQDSKADIILKYTPDEVRNLKSLGELPENLKVAENQEEDPNDHIQFARMTNVEEEDSDYSDEERKSDIDIENI